MPDAPQQHAGPKLVSELTPADSPPPAYGFADGRALGEFLRRHRELRNVALEQLAERTKVLASRLEGLERGDIRYWPSGIYRRAIVRSYASAVGLDPDEILLEFVRLFPEPDLFGPSEAPDRDHGSVVGLLRAVAVQVASRMRGLRPNRHAQAAASSRDNARPSFWRALIAIRLPARANLIAPAVALLIGYLAAGGGSAAERPLRAGRETAVALIDAAFRSAPAARATAGMVAEAGDGLDHEQPARPDQPAVLSTSQHVIAAESAEPRHTLRPAEPVRETVTTAASEPLLVITSAPSGARVTVNGIGWGATPLTIRHLAPGPKLIRVTKDGYLSAEREVMLPTDGRATVRLQLRALRPVT